MKKLILLIGIFILLFLNAYSQAEDLTITKQKKNYCQNGKTISFMQVADILATDPASTSQFRKYNTDTGIAIPIIMVSTVGLLVGSGITVVSSMQQAKDTSNGEVKDSYPSGLGIIVLSGGIATVGLTFIIAANHHKNKSLRLYNSSLKKLGYKPVQLNLMVNANGAGIRMGF